MADGVNADEDDRVPLAKAYVIGSDIELYKAEQTGDDDPSTAGFFSAFNIDIIAPPYSPDTLCKVYEQANSLKQNVDAYRTNIDGFGHVFEPAIELNAAGARESVSDAIYIERMLNVQTGGVGSLAALLPPTDVEIDAKIAELKSAMRFEKATVESFFDNCVADDSFSSLRKKTREDLEGTGNGYWEVIRNDSQRVSQFALMPSRSMRVLKIRSKTLDVSREVRVGALSFRQERYKRRFRRYVQIGGDLPVYFKEFGDPTVVSGKTGKDFLDVDALRAEEGSDAVPANEVYHFKIHSIRTGAYGVPRWAGAMLSVLGSRSAEEVNLSYFDNKTIPPLAVLVSGGRLGKDSVERIRDFFQVKLKGIRNFHKILIIEAEQSADKIYPETSSTLRVEIKQLTDAQLKDGIFLQYDAANMDKVGMMFRMPRLLRGDIRDFNRASAQSALIFAESQVFLPERIDFDFGINHFVLAELGIRLWKFKSNGPRLSDAEDWGDMITKLTTGGVLTPADARELVGKLVLMRDLPQIKADWVNQPLALTIAGVQADTEADGVIPLSEVAGVPASANPSNLKPGVTQPNPELSPNPTLLMAAKQRLFKKAKELLKLRDAFRAQEAAAVVSKYQEERREELAEEDLVLRMSEDEIAEKLGIVKTPAKTA